MAAAVRTTSTLRFVSPCCGAGIFCGLGGGALPSLGPGGIVLESCVGKTLLGAVVSASGFETGPGACTTITDGVLAVRIS